MQSPYNAQLGPGVGRGLPGLPVRGDYQQQHNSPRPLWVRPPSQLGADRVYLRRTGFYREMPGSYTNYCTIKPHAQSPDTAVMFRYNSTSSPYYQYVGLRYGPQGLTFGTPVNTGQGSYALPPQAIVLDDASWVYSKQSSSELYQVSLNTDTLAVTETLFATLPSSGTLLSGQVYTLDGGYPGLLDDSRRNVLLSPDGAVLVFSGMQVEGDYWIGCFEYDQQGQLLTVRRLFLPTLTADTVSKNKSSLRRLIVQRVKQWYHCLFADISPSSVFQVQMTYYVVSQDLTQAPLVVAADPWTPGNSDLFHLRADERSVMFFSSRDDAVTQGRAWLLALDDTGYPMPRPNNKQGQLAGSNNWFGDANSGRDDFFSMFSKRVYVEDCGLYLPMRDNYTTYTNAYAGHMYRLGVFRSHQSTTAPQASPGDSRGFAYRYRTLGLEGETLTAQIDDYARVLMFRGTGTSSSNTEQAQVVGASPLNLGYWLGVTYSGAGDTYYYQLFEEF